MPPIKTLLLKIMSKDQGGFLNGEDVTELAKLDRLRQVLVRCGACRFIISADSVNHMLAIIARDGQDYVRDVSLLAGDPAYQADYRSTTPAERPETPPVRRQEPAFVPTARDASRWTDYDRYDDGHSDADPGL